ncbi:MAG: PhnD/SsuA/transferrin family substrate-binding protein [Thiotrichaceae bacterium]|nr:PhnD/SsuA/transferrin family substrate-binding protein [Thiotrichaceae bacterium]
MNRIKHLLIFFYLFLLLIVYCTPLYSAQNENRASQFNQFLDSQEKLQISIGILSYNPLATLDGSRWKLTLERLNQHPDYFFVPVFLTIEEMQLKLEKDELDFVICDAINYLRLKKEYDIAHFLTRTEVYSAQPFSLEGLSVYTNNSNLKIVRLLDLKDKNIAVLNGDSPVAKTLLKNFLFQYGLIKDFNINIDTMNDITQLLTALAADKVDAVIAKSGIIEKYYNTQPMIRNTTMPKLVNPRQSWQSPFLHSSVLIPEWPIAKAWYIDNSLANQITSLLIDNSLLVPANQAFNTRGFDESANNFLEQYRWGIAQDYSFLYTLFPLTTDNASLQKEKQQFSTQLQYIIVFAIVFFLLVILSLFLRSSRDLNNRLGLAKVSLEKEIKERQLAQEQTLSHQDELAHVTRLSTMGEMASGLAHELNQPLSAINTYVQGCIRRINMGKNNSDEIVNALRLTAQQAERAASIIRRLRSFVRKEQSHKTYSEINTIVHEVTGFFESQFKNKEIQLNFQLQDNLPPVLIDIIQIEQIIVNLLKNAIEALIEVNEANIIISTKQLETPSHENDMIELCVIDNGHGISKDKLTRIFNPFFTTKNSGMGMGLSISSSIIEAHNGRLYASNNTIQGARFCFTLPLTKEIQEHIGNNND